MPTRDSSQHILSIVCNVFDAHSAVLFLSQHDTGPFELAAHFSLSDDIKDDALIEPGHGLAGWIIRNRQPLLINNFDQKRGLLGYYRQGTEARIRAFMGCPLDGGMGALCLDSMRTYSFSTKDQKILHQFAQLITRLKHDFCRMEADSARFDYYRALTDISSLRQKKLRWSSYLENLLTILSQTANMPYCMLAVRDEKGQGYAIEGSTLPMIKGDAGNQFFSINSGTIGWVFKNNQRVVTGEKDSKQTGKLLFGKEASTPTLRTVVCLPLIVHRKTRGVLVLAHEDNMPVSEELKRFLNMAADNLSLFLENLYLRNRLAGTETT